jgi:hypothetical protein
LKKIAHFPKKNLFLLIIVDLSKNNTTFAVEIKNIEVMEAVTKNKRIPPKCIRKGWESRSERKPRLLSSIACEGIKVTEGMYCHHKPDKYLIP